MGIVRENHPSGVVVVGERQGGDDGGVTAAAATTWTMMMMMRMMMIHNVYECWMDYTVIYGNHCSSEMILSHSLVTRHSQYSNE